MRELDIDISLVNECVESSFETKGDPNSQNKLLLQDNFDEVKAGIYLHPGITINKFIYKGYLEDV